MDKSPIVSVVLITYNQKAYLAQALNSILEQQTSFPFEVLVGDDCSTDGTDEVLAHFAGDPRVKVIPRAHNLGATRNLYDLQMRALGDYLAYLEGDDYWSDPHKLQRQVDFLETHQEYIGCTHRCIIVDEHGTPRERQWENWVSQKEVYTLKDFRGLMLPGHGNALVHRNVFRNSDGRYEELITLHPLIADRSLILLLASMGPIRRFDEPMGCYRVARAGGGTNATTVIYAENERHTWEDFQYTKALEQFAEQKLRVDGGFFYHKRELFVSAVYHMWRKPTLENRAVAKEILRDGDRVAYLLYFPIGFLKKIRERLQRRQG